MHRLLLDLSVFRRRTLGEYFYKREIFKWHEWDIPYDVALFRRFIFENDHWMRSQVDSLKKIAAKAKREKIQFFSYNEIEFEGWRGRTSNAEYTEYDMFLDIPVYAANSALERSKFSGSYLDKYLKKEKLVRFCKFLSQLNDRNIAHLMPILPLNDFEKESLSLIKDFQFLLSKMHENHYVDAFHLWTAERNKLDFFLTFDKKFVNVIRNCNFDKFECQPISPEEYSNLFI